MGKPISRLRLIEVSKPRVFMAVLAAGDSRRFGEEDKLTAPFRGKRLGEHVCANAPVEILAPACACVIASRLAHPCEPQWRAAGFEVVLNRNSQAGMGSSVALAATLAAKAECDALLIALADMPMVPTEHFAALIAASSGCGEVICSSNGEARMPPAIFGREHFHLLHASGDEGARRSLGTARALDCPPGWLIDIDTVEALDQHGQAQGQGLKAGGEGEEL